MTSNAAPRPWPVDLGDLGPLADDPPLETLPLAIGLHPPDWHPRPQGCSATPLFDARFCELSGCVGRFAGRAEPARLYFSRGGKRIPECGHCSDALANGSDGLCAACRVGLGAPEPAERWP